MTNRRRASAAMSEAGRPLLIRDPLYGPIVMPGWARPVLQSPELQRLREVGLFNASSWVLPGCGAVTRFEHAIGTAHLAILNCRSRGLAQDGLEARTAVAAALLHDVATGPFGHTVERVLVPLGFSHVNILKALQGDYRAIAEEPHFAGAPSRLRSVLSPALLNDMVSSILGELPLGPLIANDLDLDNIDNVVRGGQRLGIGIDALLATQLASGHRMRDGAAGVTPEAAALIPKWQAARRELYQILFTTNEQLSAEAMVFDAACRMVTSGELALADWQLTDHELIERFSHSDDNLVRRTARDLRLGRPYPVAHRFVIKDLPRSGWPSDTTLLDRAKTALSDAYGCDIVFPKNDLGQTERAVRRWVEGQADIHTFGHNSHDLLIALIARRSDFDRNRAQRERPSVRAALQSILDFELLDDDRAIGPAHSEDNTLW